MITTPKCELPPQNSSPKIQAVISNWSFNISAWCSLSTSLGVNSLNSPRSPWLSLLQLMALSRPLIKKIGTHFFLIISLAVLTTPWSDTKYVCNPFSLVHQYHHYSNLGSSSFSSRIISPCFPGVSDGKQSACNMGDKSSITGSERSPEEGNGNPLQYSCLENFMDRGGWQATVDEIPKSQTHLTIFKSSPCTPFTSIFRRKQNNLSKTGPLQEWSSEKETVSCTWQNKKFVLARKPATSLSLLFGSADYFSPNSNTFPVKGAECWYTFCLKLLTSLQISTLNGTDLRKSRGAGAYGRCSKF